MPGPQGHVDCDLRWWTPDSVCLHVSELRTAYFRELKGPTGKKGKKKSIPQVYTAEVLVGRRGKLWFFFYCQVLHDSKKHTPSKKCFQCQWGQRSPSLEWKVREWNRELSYRIKSPYFCSVQQLFLSTSFWSAVRHYRSPASWRTVRISQTEELSSHEFSRQCWQSSLSSKTNNHVGKTAHRAEGLERCPRSSIRPPGAANRAVGWPASESPHPSFIYFSYWWCSWGRNYASAEITTIPSSQELKLTGNSTKYWKTRHERI